MQEEESPKLLCRDCTAEFEVIGEEEWAEEKTQFCPYCGATSLEISYDYENGDWIDNGDDEEWED